jgi:two-component system sensor histidine kinase MprB
MGTRSLEASLRQRLLVVMLPALVAVGAASVLLTARLLSSADEAAARDVGEDLLRDYRTELTEGDSAEEATNEVVAKARADGARVVLRGGAGTSAERDVPILGALASVPSGSCLVGEDAAGVPWCACHVGDASLNAIAAISVATHQKLVRTLTLWTVAFVALALLATTLAARTAVRRSLGSVRRLVAWSEAAAELDRPVRAPLLDTTELVRLGEAFDGLVQRLADTLDRERATSAHIAHELRTPLTAMRIELEALEKESEGTGGAAAARLRGDVEDLARVIDAILVLASPASAPEGSGVANVADLAREAASPETRVEAPDEALVDADPRHVSLALCNLLENATKHAHRPAVLLRVTKDDAGVRVSVVDDGPGLGDEARAHMFERYWQKAPGGPGAGLGLALVRAVAERYGGTAEARTPESGKGLEVSFTLGRLLHWHDED